MVHRYHWLGPIATRLKCSHIAFFASWSLDLFAFVSTCVLVNLINEFVSSGYCNDNILFNIFYSICRPNSTFFIHMQPHRGVGGRSSGEGGVRVISCGRATRNCRRKGISWRRHSGRAVFLAHHAYPNSSTYVRTYIHVYVLFFAYTFVLKKFDFAAPFNRSNPVNWLAGAFAFLDAVIVFAMK